MNKWNLGGPGYARVDAGRAKWLRGNPPEEHDMALRRGVLAIGPVAFCDRVECIAKQVEGVAFSRAAAETVNSDDWRHFSGACVVLSSRAGAMPLSEICRISAMGSAPPVINVADDCSVEYAIEAMELGAYSVLEGSASDGALQEAIVAALADDLASRELRVSVAEWQQRSQQLTETERRVVSAEWEGRAAEATARELGIDTQSVQQLMTSAYRKLGVRSRAEAVRMLALESVIAPTMAYLGR
jgi:DNA-binding NarL/FixJ family response regulator